MINLPILPKQITDKYEINRNTFIRKDKGEKAEERGIIIGDDKQDDFFPQVKLTQWEETNFSVRLKHTEKNAKIETDGDKVKWKGRKVEAHFYEVEKTDDLPKAFELEVLLLEKPKTNKVGFTTQTKGLKFYYQPELTQKEKDEGAFRPENVIGSYAVYHESKAGDYSKMGKKNYRAGKAFHIFRPRIIDNAGTEVWGKLNITDNLLTVEIPQEFLDNAVYPVRHAAGLTFGYLSEGNSLYTFSGTNEDGDELLARIGNPGQAGVADNIKAYMSTSANSRNNKGALYDASNVLLSPQTDIVWVNIDNTWYTFTFTNGPSLTNQNYYIAIFNDAPSYSNGSQMHYDSGGSSGDGKRQQNRSYPTFPNPLNGVNNTNKYSIYCTYTAGGGSDLKSVNSVALADIKSINSIAIANVKSVNGITK